MIDRLSRDLYLSALPSGRREAESSIFCMAATLLLRDNESVSDRFHVPVKEVSDGGHSRNHAALSCAKVAVMFRTDPKVASLLDPAVYIAADGDGVIASVVERLQLTEPIFDLKPAQRSPIWDEEPEDAPIAVLVVDEDGASVFRVPDPRICPDQWPWTGLGDDQD